MTPLLPLGDDPRTLELVYALDPMLARLPVALRPCADLALGVIATRGVRLLVAADPALAAGRSGVASLRRPRFLPAPDGRAVVELPSLQQLRLRVAGRGARVERVPLPLPRATADALLVQHLFLGRLERLLAALGVESLAVASPAASAIDRCGEVLRLRGYRPDGAGVRRRLPAGDDALRR